MTGLLPPSPAVLRSYRLSTYRAGSVTARIGRVPDGVVRPLVVLSACNPGGRRRPDGWNDRMMRALAVALRGFAVLPGEGRLGRWSEGLVMAEIPVARGITLARRFRQNAVVLLHPGRPARLVLLAGDGSQEDRAQEDRAQEDGAQEDGAQEDGASK